MKNLILTLLTFASFSAYAGLNPGYIFKIDESYRFTVPQIDDNSLSLEILKARSQAAANYQDFLADLNRSYPNLFKAPVLVHSSGSAQYSSFERPRVIVHQGRTVLGFSESPSTKVREVEVLNYDPETGRYTAAEITFEGGTATMKLNPTACTACHGEATRPVWLSYDLWPRQYGTLAGFFSSPAEQNQFKKFQQESSNLGVYQYLKEIINSDGLLEGNDDLTLILNNFSRHSLLLELKKQKEKIFPWRYALIGAARGCSESEYAPEERVSFESFIPENLRAGFKKPFSFFANSTNQSRQKKTAYLTRVYENIFASPMKNIDIESRLDDEVLPLTNERYLLENFGFPFETYQSGNGMFRYSMALPSNLAMDSSTQAVQLFPEVFAELQPKLNDFGGGRWVTFNCRELAGKSQAALASLGPQDIPQFSSDRRLTPLGRCVSCHAAEGIGPAIPFDDSHRLADWLRKSGGFQDAVERIQSGNMPQDARLTESEKAAIIEAFLRVQAIY